MRLRLKVILGILVFCGRVMAASTATLVADLNPGPNGSYPSNLTVFSRTLYFNAYTLETGRELWKYDGTNVTLVADINPTKDDIGFGILEGNDSLAAWLTPFNGALYFSAYEPARGAELWRTTGTGAERVADINPDLNDTYKFNPNSSWPSELTVVNGVLYFSANNNPTRTNYELWKYDGATASLAANIHADSGTNYSSYPNNLAAFDNALYFMADNGTNGFELWKFDGMKATLMDLNPGDESSSSFPKHFKSFGGQLYFPAFRADVGYELFRTDGTNATLAADIVPGVADSFPDGLTEFNGALYFRAAGELWKFDGTNATLAAEINAAGDSSPKNLTVFGSQLVFAADDGVHGWELWKFDGANARMIVDLNPSGDAFPESFLVVSNLLYFTATTPDTGYEVFVYDGTNVTLAADINPGPGDSFPQFLTEFNGDVYFRAANDGASNWELWKISTAVTPPPPPPVPIQFQSIELVGADVKLTWKTGGGTTNIVQSANDIVGPFVDVSPQIIVPGSGETTEQFTDTNATSSGGNRFYRIKQE